MKQLLALILVFSLFVGGRSYSYAAVSKFSDTKGHWAANAIQWAVENNIAQGYPSGEFMPNRQVSEAEFLVMFLRAFGITNPPQPEKQSHWADAYYDYAVSRNYPLSSITNLDVRNDFDKRVRVAELIAAADGANFHGDNAIQYVLGKGYSTGSDSNNITIENFKGNSLLTRGEAVQFIKNLIDKGLTELKNNPEQPSNINSLPKLPEKMDQLSIKILTGVKKKLTEDKYKSYEVVLDNKVIIIKNKNNQTSVVSINFAEYKNERNKIMVYNTAVDKDLELGIAIASIAGIDITKSQIKAVIQTAIGLPGKYWADDEKGRYTLDPILKENSGVWMIGIYFEPIKGLQTISNSEAPKPETNTSRFKDNNVETYRNPTFDSLMRQVDQQDNIKQNLNDELLKLEYLGEQANYRLFEGKSKVLFVAAKTDDEKVVGKILFQYTFRGLAERDGHYLAILDVEDKRVLALAQIILHTLDFDIPTQSFIDVYNNRSENEGKPTSKIYRGTSNGKYYEISMNKSRKTELEIRLEPMKDFLPPVAS